MRSPHTSLSSHSKRRMSLPFLLPSLPPRMFGTTSPPLYDDEMREAEQYIANERVIDAAEQARLIEYLHTQERADAERFHLPPPAALAAAPAADPVAALADGMRLLAVPEEDEEEIDTHSCGDSECQGAHLHDDAGDYYGISPSYSPNYGGVEYDAYGCEISEPPYTPYYD